MDHPGQPGDQLHGPQSVDYGLYEVEAMEADLPFEPWAKPGDRLILADKLADSDARANAKIASRGGGPNRC